MLSEIYEEGLKKEMPIDFSPDCSGNLFVPVPKLREAQKIGTESGTRFKKIQRLVLQKFLLIKLYDVY